MIFRTLTSKLATMGIVMATISLLFTATLLTEGAGMVFNGIFQGRVEHDAFDLLFVSDQEEHMEQCWKSMEQLPLSASWQYKLYQGVDDSAVVYLEETSGYYRYNYDHDYNCTLFMTYSDYAALREMLGLPPAELEPDCYIIHCMPYLEEPLRQWRQTLSLDGKTLSPGKIYTEQFAQNLWNGNGHQFLLILPDEVCVTRPVLRFAVAAMTAQNITVEQYNALSSGLHDEAADEAYLLDEWDYLYSKAILLHDTAAWSAMAVFPLFYLALILAMTAATVLTVQQLSEAGRYHRQFELLRKLGYERVKVTQGSGDQGVDVIAVKNDKKYAIQCKRYSKKLGNKPVQEVNAGRTIYGCSIAVVVTNNYFTDGAKEAAQATGVELWDRDTLKRMITYSRI